MNSALFQVSTSVPLPVPRVHGLRHFAHSLSGRLGARPQILLLSGGTSLLIRSCSSSIRAIGFGDR